MLFWYMLCCGLFFLFVGTGVIVSLFPEMYLLEIIKEVMCNSRVSVKTLLD